MSRDTRGPAGPAGTRPRDNRPRSATHPGPTHPGPTHPGPSGPTQPPAPNPRAGQPDPTPTSPPPFPMPPSPGPTGVAVLLPLLVVAGAFMGRREWPPEQPDHRTAEPRPGGMDLTDAADHYAREVPQAAKRRGGFRMGNPVRRNKR